MFLRGRKAADRPAADAFAGDGPAALPVDAPPARHREPGALEKLAQRFAIGPAPAGQVAAAGDALAAALQRAELWREPSPGRVQDGVRALLAGRAPAALIGAHLSPVLVGSRSGPALVLVDGRARVHVIVDVVAAHDGAPPRPHWVPAGALVHCPRTSGSHHLWRSWQPELSEHRPHEDSSACDGHVHLARPDAHGHLVTGVPQHDAWMMTRSWLPAEFALPSIEDAHWVVLSASPRAVAERERAIRSHWASVSFDEFAEVLAGDPRHDAGLPPRLRELVAAMLPAATR